MGRLRLTLACGDYDRTLALRDGTCRPDGLDLTYLSLPVEETFFRMMRHREFDVAELSLSSYVVSLGRSPRPFVALPVYPSRMFRHGSIYINANAGIERPEDLRGRVVGLPEYQLSACVWVRGILADEYHVPVSSVSYRTGGQESPGRIEKASIDLPSSIDIRPIGNERTLSEMLVSGEIDALYTPRLPRPFVAGDPSVRRLFPDLIATERDYFTKTGIFPIMHVLVIRREIYERDRWVAQSLTRAMELARRHALDRLYDTSALRVTLPWLTSHLETSNEQLGPEVWSYGLEKNRGELETFLRYHHDQGLSPRRYEPEELFAPESLERFVI